MRTSPIPALRLAALLLAVFAAAALPMDRSSSPPARRFTDVPRQSAEFIGFARTIALSPAQQELRDRVLERIPAACCSKFSARTCCCPCNLAKTVWGLSNLLIAREGADAAAVDRAVRSWLAFVNPGGFSGKVCDQPGGCGRQFSRDGCGGMNEKALIAAR
jgi:hypothetical protein